MGTSWAEIQAGVLDTGKVVSEAMLLWNQVTGKTTTAATTVPATTTQSVTPTSQIQSAAAAATTIPTWAIVALGIGAVVLLMRR
jgi:hypothetical protein